MWHEFDPIEEAAKAMAAPYVLACLKELWKRGEEYSNSKSPNIALMYLLKDINDGIISINNKINNGNKEHGN